MSNDINYRFEIYKSYFKKEKVKIIFFLLMLNSFYGIIWSTSTKNYYIPTLLEAYTNIYFSVFLLFIILYNTIIIFSIFNENKNYILRLKNFTNYIHELIYTIIFSNIIIIILQLIIAIMTALLTAKFGLGLQYYEIGNTYNLIYFLVFFIRASLIEILFSVTCILLLSRINKTAVIFLFSILIVALPNSIVYSSEIIDSYFKMHLFYGFYLIPCRYSSFFTELHFSIIYILLLYIFTKSLEKIILYIHRRFPCDITN